MVRNFLFWKLFSQYGRRLTFWMAENHFRSHFSPFQINMQLLFLLIFFTKWPPAANSDNRKLLLIVFFAISDQYATFIFWKFYYKMAAGGHFEWSPSILGQWLHQIWNWSVHLWLSYGVYKLFHHIFTKWPLAAILVFHIFPKIYRVLLLNVINGCVKYELRALVSQLREGQALGI